MYTKQWGTRLAAGLVFVLCMALGFSMAGAPKASAMTTDDAIKYAIQHPESDGAELNTKAGSEAYPLAKDDNGWGWDPATATLTFRNYDDRARLKSEDHNTKFKSGFLVFNSGEKDVITIKFEGTNYLSANAGNAGVVGLALLPNGKEVRFVGDQGAVLNIDTYALYDGDGKSRLQQSGIELRQGASDIAFKSGTVNITGHYTQEDFVNKSSKFRNIGFTGIDAAPQGSGAAKVSVSGDANLNIKVDTSNTTVGSARALYAKTFKVTTKGQVNLEGYNYYARLSGSVTDGKWAETDAIFNGAGKVTYKWTNGDGEYTYAFPFKTNTTQDNINNHKSVGYLNPVAGGSIQQGYLQGNAGKAVKVAKGETVSAEIGRVYGVSTALEANDSGVTEEPTARYFDGSNAYPLKKPFGVGETLPEVQAIGEGNTVLVTAQQAPAGYVLVWEVKQDGQLIPEDNVPDFCSKIGVRPASAEQLSALNQQPISELTEEGFFYPQPAANLEWKAIYKPLFKVAFDMGGHGKQIPAQEVVSGKKAAAPAAPTAKGWVFKGWYADKELKTPFDFNAAITADTTVYAKWAEESKPTPNVQHPTQPMVKSGVDSLEIGVALAALVALALGVATVAISRRRG